MAQINNAPGQPYAGLDFVRLGEWFADAPRRRSCRSPFDHLLTEPVAA